MRDTLCGKKADDELERERERAIDEWDAMDWVICESCSDGFVGHDCGEDTCCCLRPVDNVPCQVCDGKGGWKRVET